MERIEIVVDIGGTNTRVAQASQGRVLETSLRRYKNSGYANLDEVLDEFIGECGFDTIDAICVAAAGPVLGGRAEMTNLSWIIDESALTQKYNTEKSIVLNDLQAQGYSLPHLQSNSLNTLLKGSDAADKNAMLVLGIGTGFNAAPVYKNGASLHVPAAEAGHASLPAHTVNENAFLQYFTERNGFTAVEDALSGRGLENIYGWLSGEERDAAEIMARVADNSDANATAALQHLTRVLGTVAGNLALITLPFGGIFLAGGVARAIAPYLVEFGLREAFTDKGRFADFMDRFSLHVIEDDYAALIGCAEHLHTELKLDT